MWIVAYNSVDDIIFVHVLVLILVQVPLYSPLPGLPNGHCALYSLSFVVAAWSVLRPFGLSCSAQCCCLLFFCLYVGLCMVTLFYADTYFAIWPYYILWSLLYLLSRMGMRLYHSRPLGFAWQAYLALNALLRDLPRRNCAEFQTRSLSRVIPVAPPSALVIKFCSLFVPPAFLAPFVCGLSYNAGLSFNYDREEFEIFFYSVFLNQLEWSVT